MSRNLIVGQSGGPTAVINASLAGVIEEAQQQPGIDRVLGMRRGIEGLLEDQIIDLTDLTGARLEILARTPGAALGGCRRKVTPQEVEQLLRILGSHEVTRFCYIGGNDSADTTHTLAEAALDAGQELAAVAIPKTIDNDLAETDHCPGYGSIARYVAIAAAESSLDTRSLPSNYPVKIIEVMGRDAGWVAAASGLTTDDPDAGPHLIYVPELPFYAEKFLDSVAKFHSRLGYVVVVVAETVRDQNGAPVADDEASVDDFGHPIVRGTAGHLVHLVEREIGIPARFDKPGSLQRSSWFMQSSVDLAEARATGREAVRLAVAGETDRMITIKRRCNHPYTIELSSTGLDKVANRQSLLPREFLDQAGTQITTAFRDYALPLLGPDPFPAYFRL